MVTNQESTKQAMLWLKKAAANGDVLSKQQLESLLSHQQEKLFSDHGDKLFAPKLTSLSKHDLFKTTESLEAPHTSDEINNSLQLVEKAAAENNLSAQTYLANYHICQNKVSSSIGQAFEFYEKMANAG